ncbi:odorant receptor 83a-like isoform X2 [Cotesia glomerata]|uniref:odorant receptor 83a-like isoform X2 n=1 Tax=Cotesia glomerata TaxID=32391 RepID=UPI001D027939|nr:odorant receptor 83a-like isoform X2 [Cotesia glomerata]
MFKSKVKDSHANEMPFTKIWALEIFFFNRIGKSLHNAFSEKNYEEKLIDTFFVCLFLHSSFVVISLYTLFVVECNMFFLAELIPPLFSVSTIVVKSAALWLHRRDLFTVLRHFYTLWNYNKTKTDLLNKINKLLITSKKFRYYYMSTVTMCFVAYALRPIIIVSTYWASLSEQSNSTFDFPIIVYPLQYPFEYQTIAKYSLLILYEELVNYSAACCLICDALYIQLMTHISINFLVLADDFKNASQCIDNDVNDNKQIKNMVKLVNKHRHMLVICQKVESVYNPIVLFTIIINGLNLCFSVIVLDKGLTLWFYRHDLFTIIRDFLTLWNYNQTKTNLLNNINNLMKSSKRVRYYYMFTVILIGTSFGLRPLIMIFTCCVSSSGQSNSTFDFSVVVYPLAYPFTYQTVSRYSLLLLYEEFVNYFAVCYVICDALYIQLMTHISINFLVLADDFNNVNQCVDSDDNDDSKIEHMVKLVDKHRQMLVICEKVESFYNPIVFFTIVMNGLDLCLCVIVIDKEISEGNWPIVIKCFVHAVALFVQIIIYCNFSHIATEMTASIENSIYNSEWVNNSNKFKKMIMMIMMRTSKEYKFTAYGILVLNREQMAKVIQTTMSYFTLLRSFT